MKNTIEITNEQQIISTIKEIDQILMKTLNARLQFSDMLKRARASNKRNFKEEQEFIANAAEVEMYPGAAYAIWPSIMEFAREIEQ